MLLKVLVLAHPLLDGLHARREHLVHVLHVRADGAARLVAVAAERALVGPLAGVLALVGGQRLLALELLLAEAALELWLLVRAHVLGQLRLADAGPAAYGALQLLVGGVLEVAVRLELGLRLEGDHADLAGGWKGGGSIENIFGLNFSLQNGC